MKLPRIPVANSGAILPLGLSRFELGYRLRMPLLVWHRTGYEITADAMASGWWRLDACARFERGGITIRWGWTFLRGTVKPWGDL